MRIHLLLIILSSFLLSSCSSTVSSIKEDVDVNLSSDSGYLLVGINLNRNIRSIEIVGPKDVNLTQQDLKFNTNYFLVEMPIGDYRFDKVRLNKIYRMELKKGYWDFKVNPGEISYVGHLQIQASGAWSTNTHLELKNKSVNALVFLENNFPNILAKRKVRYRGPGNDRFFELVEAQFNSEVRK